MASESTSIEDKKLNVGWQINATTLISVLVSLVFGAIAGSGIYWNMKTANEDLHKEQVRAATEFTAYQLTAEKKLLEQQVQGEKKAAELRVEYREQLANQRVEFRDQMADVRARTEMLPDLRARIAEMDRRQATDDQWKGRIEGGIGELRDLVQGLKGQMTGLGRPPRQ